MADRIVLAGTTSRIAQVQLTDVVTGLPKTGLVYNTSGLTCYYARPGAASVSVSLATLAAVTSIYSSGGFKEIDATNAPGLYRFDIPNAAIAGSATGCKIYFTDGSANVYGVLDVELWAVNPQDAAAFGLTNFDAAITTRLAPTVSLRTLDVTATGAAGIDLANVENPTTTLALTGTTVKLAADGLDAITDTLPTGDPTAWNWRQRLVHAVARITGRVKLKKNYTSSGGTLETYDGSDVLAYTQDRTRSGFIETVDATEEAD